MLHLNCRIAGLWSRAVVCVGLLFGVFAGAQAHSGSVPLRVAIVGLVHDHVSGFLAQLPQHHDVELVGVVEENQALASKYEKRFGLSHEIFYSDAEAMISAQHPQALLAYTSIAGHRKVVELGAEHGISVMVEKPLTLSLDDALAIRKLARAHHIHVLVNYETTWYASNKAAFDEVGAGKLGAIRRVVVHDGHRGPKEIGVSPEFLGWLTDPAQNGAGALYDFGCYGVDLMTWLMHGEVPETVTAVVNRDKPAIYAKVDDDSTIVLQYPQTQAVLQGSWNWPFARKDMEIYGTTGTVITVGADMVRVRHEHDDAEKLLTAQPLPTAQSNSLSYLAAVLSGEVKDEGDLSALDTNIVVMQILDAARTSARTGQSVRLEKLPE